MRINKLAFKMKYNVENQPIPFKEIIGNKETIYEFYGFRAEGNCVMKSLYNHIKSPEEKLNFKERFNFYNDTVAIKDRVIRKKSLSRMEYLK